MALNVVYYNILINIVLKTAERGAKGEHITKVKCEWC